MARAVVLSALLVALLTPAGLRGQDDDPVLQQRKLSEWLRMLQADPQADHRRAALIAVQILGPRHARKALPGVATALRGDADEKVRAGAATVLGQLAARARKDNLDGFRYDSVRDALAASLRGDPSGRVREAAAAALGHLDEDARGAVPVLAGALKDKHPGTRTAAAESLRRLGTHAKEVLPELQQVLGDGSADRLTRVLCARAVGRIGVPDSLAALPALQDVLVDARAPAELRTAAAETLGLFGKDAAPAAGALGNTLTSARADTPLRRAAAIALDALGPEGRDALPALQKALRDEDRYVRCHALHALGGYGKELGPDTRDIVTGILRCLDDSVLEVRVAAIETLGVLGREGLGGDAQAVADRLTDAARDPQKAIREAAAAALKRIHGPS
jgi:HEAT repeat protein